MESVVASKPQAGARPWTGSQIVPIRDYSNLSFPTYGQQRNVDLEHDKLGPYAVPGRQRADQSEGKDAKQIRSKDTCR